MSSYRQRFFHLGSFAVIGDSAADPPFPERIYDNLRRLGKRLFAVDLGGRAMVCGEPALGALSELPEPVEGALVELPQHRVMPVVQQLVEIGVEHLWLQRGSETAAVLKYCYAEDLDIRWGTCALVYTDQGLSLHSFRRALYKLRGRF